MKNYLFSYRSIWCLKKRIYHLSLFDNSIKELGCINNSHIQTYNQKKQTTLRENVNNTISQIIEYAKPYNSKVLIGFELPLRLLEDTYGKSIQVAFLSKETAEYFTKTAIEYLKTAQERRKEFILELMGLLMESGYPISPYELKERTVKKIYEYDFLDIADQLLLNHPDRFSDEKEPINLINNTASTIKIKEDWVFDFINTIEKEDECYLLDPENNPGFIEDYHPFCGIITNPQTPQNIIEKARKLNWKILPGKREKISYRIRYT